MKVRQTVEIEVEGLGDRIREARLAYQARTGATMKAIAAAANMTRQNWHRYEANNVEYIPLDTLRDMERAIEWDSGVKLQVQESPPFPAGA